MRNRHLTLSPFAAECRHLFTAAAGRTAVRETAAGATLAACVLLSNSGLVGGFFTCISQFVFPFESFSFHITIADAAARKRTQDFLRALENWK